MATVTSFTKERLLAIESNTIVAARKDPNTGDIILTTHGGVDINLGNLDGRGIQSTEVGYQVTPYGEDTPIGPWFASIPQLVPGMYLWTRTIITYTDHTQTSMYSVARIGEDGSAGIPPRKVNSLVVVSNSSIITPIGPKAAIVLEWEPVTLGTDGNPVEIREYQLWTHEFSVMSVTDPTATIVIDSGKTEEYLVKAIAVDGAVGELSFSIEVTGSTPAVIDCVPTKPTLTSVNGFGILSWDGLFVDPGSGSHVIAVERQNGSNWEQIGSRLTESAVITIKATPDELLRVRLSAYDQLGRYAGSSEISEIIIVGVELPDLGQDFIDQLNSFQRDLTNGKIFVQSDPPAIPVPESDQHVWLSSTTPSVPYRVVGGVWAVATDDAAVNLAALVDAADPSEFDSFGHLKAYSATMKKLAVNMLWADEAWIGVLSAGIIKVDFLEPNIGDILNLSANGSIEMIVGRLDDTAITIEGVVEQVGDVNNIAQDARQSAAEASAQAAIAEGKALVAEQAAKDVDLNLKAQQAVFRVTETGAEIATLDGANKLSFTPDGMEIIQGGAKASTWNAGRLIVNEARLTRAVIANHTIEKSGTVRTIFRQN